MGNIRVDDNQEGKFASLYSNAEFLDGEKYLRAECRRNINIDNAITFLGRVSRILKWQY